MNRSEQVKRSWAERRAKYGPSGFAPNTKPRPRLTDDEYNRLWMARILRTCKKSESGCLEWQGYLHPARGYAHSSYRGKGCFVHRQIYQVTHAVKLGRWQFVCHTCDNRLCCNINHLWVGTPKENQQDMSRKGRAGLQSDSHCKRGHEFIPENTYRAPSTGRRGCKACQRDRMREDYYVKWRRAYQAKRRARLRAQRQEQTHG